MSKNGLRVEKACKSIAMANAQLYILGLLSSCSWLGGDRSISSVNLAPEWSHNHYHITVGTAKRSYSNICITSLRSQPAELFCMVWRLITPDQGVGWTSGAHGAFSVTNWLNTLRIKLASFPLWHCQPKCPTQHCWIQCCGINSS